MEQTELLSKLVLFRDLPAELLLPLQQAAEQRSFAAGEAIFHHGEEPDFFYVIESGTVDVAVPARAGDIVVASFERGSFFGELAVFDRQPRSAGARAVADTRLICIPLQAVAELVENHAPAARQFIGILALRLRGADELLSRLQVQNVNEIADERMSLGGSWTFITSFMGFLLLWMLGNTAYLLSSPPDPFPYIFLNLILSCIAALQAPVIMMSQNRQSLKDRLRADQEFQINVQAEIAVQQLHRKIDELRGTMLQHLNSGETSNPR
jgi:CRP-like cAMP-binding protein